MSIIYIILWFRGVCVNYIIEEDQDRLKAEKICSISLADKLNRLRLLKYIKLSLKNVENEYWFKVIDKILLCDIIYTKIIKIKRIKYINWRCRYDLYRICMRYNKKAS